MKSPFGVLLVLSLALICTCWPTDARGASPPEQVTVELPASSSVSPAVVQHGVRHGHRTHPRIPGKDSPEHVKNTNVTSTNWSGYAVESTIATPNTAVYDVKGTWTVPTVSMPGSGKSYCAIWVGIDGYDQNDGTVEQIGISGDVTNGVASYYAWYEMYPADPVNLTSAQLPVSPGDQITAEVFFNSSLSAYVLTITNVTKSKTYTTTQSATGQLRWSAEWIVEAPASGTDGSILPLDYFRVVNFSACSATIYGTTGSIGSWPSTDISEMTMINSTTGSNEAVPSALTGGGASFSVTNVTVTYAVVGAASPTAGGRVTLNPSAGPNYYGSVIGITAAANPGYVFANWKATSSGTISNSTALTTNLTITGSCTVTASFTAIPYPLTVSASPSAGGSIALSPNLASYAISSVVSISETTNPGYTFAGWTVTGGTISNPAAATTSLTITSSCTLTANYTPISYPLTASASPSAGGSIALSPNQASYSISSVVSISETTNPGYTFAGWTVAGGTISNPAAATTSLTITSSCTLTANFTLSSFSGTETDVGGSITLSSSGPYTYGQVITATESANIGYAFAGWSVTGSTALSSSAVVTTSLTVYGNFTLTASFTQLLYTLSTSACPSAGGTVAVSPSQVTYTYGNVLSISETTNPGYTFAGWTASGGTLSSSTAQIASLTITGNCTLKALFTLNSYSGTEADVGGSLTLSSTGPYYYGTQITATASANPGYIFTGWTATGGSLSSSGALTTTLTVLGNFTLTANFSAATLTASAALDNTWVYQNTPVTTLNRQCRTMTITVPQDSWPDQNFTVQVSTGGSGVVIPSLTFVAADGSGSVTPTSSFVFTSSSAALYLVGGPRQADGVTGTGSCTVTLQLTGDQSGAANAVTVQATLTVRSLGNTTGDGTVTAADRVQLRKWINGLPTPNQTFANFDLDGDGAVTGNDLAVLNALLNTLSVP